MVIYMKQWEDKILNFLIRIKKFFNQEFSYTEGFRYSNTLVEIVSLK